MPRFKRRAFRRFSRPVKRERLIWWTTNFNEAPQNTAGLLTQNIILGHDQLEATQATGPSTIISIRRVIVNGGVVVAPGISGAVTFDTLTAFTALVVQDVADTDVTLVSTARGDIYEGGVERILWSGCDTRQSTAGPVGQVSVSEVGEPFTRYAIDWKGRANLKIDHRLMLLFQAGGNWGAAGAVSTVALSATIRCLIQIN